MILFISDKIGKRWFTAQSQNNLYVYAVRNRKPMLVVVMSVCGIIKVSSTGERTIRTRPNILNKFLTADRVSARH
jgi:hypothetical protein